MQCILFNVTISSYIMWVLYTFSTLFSSERENNIHYVLYGMLCSPWSVSWLKLNFCYSSPNMLLDDGFTSEVLYAWSKLSSESSSGAWIKHALQCFPCCALIPSTAHNGVSLLSNFTNFQNCWTTFSVNKFTLKYNLCANNLKCSSWAAFLRSRCFFRHVYQ